ncbi:M48 family metallopeptidase, partial [Chloroflexota bacterium]
DYVIIHELAHLKEMNHSKNFWKVVAEHCPQWRKRKKWLRDHAYLTEALRACGGMVDFKVTDGKPSVLFEAEGYQLVVMPMLTADGKPKPEDTEATEPEPEAEAEAVIQPTVKLHNYYCSLQCNTIDVDSCPNMLRTLKVIAEHKVAAQQAVALPE